jgi:fructokinase
MDVVCMGELLVDMFPAEAGRRLVEVSSFRPKPGGAPANVAVALARLGRKSAFLGKVGDDLFGHHLAGVLVEAGVNTRGMRYDDYARTTMAFIASPDANIAEYLFYRNPGADTRLQPGELDRGLLKRTKVLHFGSLSLVEDPIRSALLEAVRIVREAGGRISLDVNYRPSLWRTPDDAYSAVWEILPQVDLLKVNEVELALLTGEDDPESGSERLTQQGPIICVLTSGAGGSFFRIAGGFGFVPAFNVDAIDATGCGDAFIAGLLSRLLISDDWRSHFSPEQFRQHLQYANAVGALTATKQGVIPALPAAEAVADFLLQQPEWRDEYG